MRYLLVLFISIILVASCTETTTQASIDDAIIDPIESDDANSLERYTPTQPIEFSHEIHSGENDIDCKYCHSSVNKSKSAGLPSVNVCMNCHRTISQDNPSSAIQRIYDAAGYNAEKKKFDSETKPIVWQRVHSANYEGFSHAAHTQKGLSCNECHGSKHEEPLPQNICAKCHY